MMDWKGERVPPSRLQALLRDNPRTRAYAGGTKPRAARGLAASFEDYLAARLATLPKELDDILEFLRGCTYAKDPERFGRPDVWLHPEDFEHLREGDCEDHALWAWVQFVRMGWDARFTAGLHEERGHAWVTLFRARTVVILESTARKSGSYLVEARGAPYEPVWSVCGEARFYYHPPAGRGIISPPGRRHRP